MSKRDGPVILDLDDEPLPDVPGAAEAPPLEDLPGAGEQALKIAARPRRRWGIGWLFWSAAGALIGLALVIGVSDFVLGLFARHPWLGWIGAALAGLLVLALAVMALGELAALARLRRVEALQAQAASGDGPALVRGLSALYRGRPELERGLADLAKAERESPDAQAVLETAEARVLGPIDLRAQAAVARSARDVAAATALIPIAVIDVFAVLWANLRMIRQIAELYGGRAGWLGSWRLLRAVAMHLVATGAVAATEDMLGPLLGGGVLGKLSRRFGEAAVNAALTARVGVAAIEVCRPMPFAQGTKPRAASLVLDALRGWRKEGQENPTRGGQ